MERAMGGWWLGALLLIGCGDETAEEPVPAEEEVDPEVEVPAERRSEARLSRRSARTTGRPRAARKRARDEDLREQQRMLGYTTSQPEPQREERQARLQQLRAERQEALQAMGYVGGAPSTTATRSEPLLSSLRLKPSMPAPAPAPVEQPVGEKAWTPPPGHTLTAQQPFTTLATDVDDASWVRARRELEAGGTPRPSEVRLEEFVNAMTYRYPDPVRGDFGVTTERVAHPNHPDWELVRVGVQGRRGSADDRPPLNLTFLVDTSCSMAGSTGLDLAQEALVPFAEQLGEQDSVSVVTFSQHARVGLEATRADREGRRAFAETIRKLQPNGGTGMSLGLDLAYEQALRHHRPGVVSRVVLVSDGDANVGQLSGDRMAASIRKHADQGVALTALGVDTGRHGDQVLEALSNKGDGQYFGLADAGDAQRVLVDDFVGTFVPLARDVKLQVEWDPQVVRSHRMLGYENRVLGEEQFRQDVVDGGEIGMGHQVTALFVVRREPDTDEKALGVLRLRSKPPGADTEATETAFVLHGPRAGRPADAGKDTVVAMAAVSLGSMWVGEPLLALGEVVGPLREAVDPSRPEHGDLLDAVRRVLGETGGAPQGWSGVVSMQTDIGAFDQIQVRCGDVVKRGRFTGGRAVVSGLPDEDCVADLAGGRPTVSLTVVPGESYRCDEQPLRCRVLQ